MVVDGETEILGPGQSVAILAMSGTCTHTIPVQAPTPLLASPELTPVGSVGCHVSSMDG
jgi:hypothetical protein